MDTLLQEDATEIRQEDGTALLLESGAALATPTGLATVTRVDLTWDVVSTATSYHIYRTDGGVTTEVYDGPLLAFTDTPTPDGAPTYTVSAENAEGESMESDPVTPDALGSGLGGSGDGPTAAEIAAAVWAAAPAGPTLAEVGTAVWDEAPDGTPVEDIATAVWDGAPPGPTVAELGAAPWDHTGTPLAGVPAASSTKGDWLGWVLKTALHKMNVTASGIALRNAADTADDATTTHAEVTGTYTRNKWS